VDILEVITHRLRKEEEPIVLELEVSRLFVLGCGSFTEIARYFGWCRVIKAASSREIWIRYAGKETQ
jgi:hypothetical protein